MWPGSWRGQWGTASSRREQPQTMEDHGESTERGQMVGGPLGDMVDVLSPRNLSAAALQRYAVLVLAGDVEEDRMRAALPSRLALVLCFTIV